MAAKAMRNEKNGPQITIALIGLIGTVITVMGTIVVAAVNNWKISPQSVSLPTVLQAASPISVSPPSQPELTGDYSIPGQDWMHDCIGSAWNAFPTVNFKRDANGCLDQPLPSVISAQGGSLSLLSQASVNSARMFGISTVLPLHSNIDMHLSLAEIQTGQVWIGIMGGSDPLNSPGMMMVLSEGDVQNQVFVVRQIPQSRELLRSASIPAESGGYDVHLAVDNGSVTIKINSMQTSPFPLPFSNRQLFIGFRDQFGYNVVNAQISNLKIFGN